MRNQGLMRDVRPRRVDRSHLDERAAVPEVRDVTARRQTPGRRSIAHLEDRSSEEEGILEDELRVVAARFGDPRRTEIRA